MGHRVKVNAIGTSPERRWNLQGSCTSVLNINLLQRLLGGEMHHIASTAVETGSALSPGFNVKEKSIKMKPEQPRKSHRKPVCTNANHLR